MYVLLGRLVYKDFCYLFSNLYYSLFIPDISDILLLKNQCVVNSPTQYDNIF